MAGKTGRGILLVLSGPSGAGKTTLAQAFMERAPELARSISATTREPRAGERDGRDYLFLSNEAFEAKARAGEFTEHMVVFGERYGTPRAPLDEALAAGRDVLMDVDVQGAAAIRAAYPDDAVLVFVLPPDEASLARRLAGRATDSDEAVAKRAAEAAREIARAREYDYIVVNAGLEEAVGELVAIRRAEHGRTCRRGGETAWRI